MKIVFGPVPSRRLGRSLGVNNIPLKHCSYSCIYCQLGETRRKTISRAAFYRPEEIASEVAERLETAGEADYVTFVPDGEPTLDMNLGEAARLIRRVTSIPLAILSNASLIWMSKVREDLKQFDLVSLKLDSTINRLWLQVNRPHPELVLEKILGGIKTFQREFGGSLIFEVMLVKGVNDTVENAIAVSTYLSGVRFDRVYLAVPTRPPTLSWVKPVERSRLNIIYKVFAEMVGQDRVSVLPESEGPNFHLSDNIENDILSIVRVHPLREDYASILIRRRGGSPKMIIRKMVGEGKIRIRSYMGHRFILAADLTVEDKVNV